MEENNLPDLQLAKARTDDASLSHYESSESRSSKSSYYSSGSSKGSKKGAQPTNRPTRPPRRRTVSVFIKS